MDWLDYREKLGLGFTDSEKWEHCINFIFNDLYLMDYECSDVEYIEFCNMVGIPLDVKIKDNSKLRTECVLDNLRETVHNPKKFLSYYIAILNTRGIDTYIPHRTVHLADLIDTIEIALHNAHIPFEVYTEKHKFIKNENYYFIFPKGAKELDDTLVSQPLEWLRDYPDSQKAFVRALKAYADVTDDTASETADKFRKALETFFQEFFGGGKSLENYRSEYGTYLKEKGVPSEISNNFSSLLKSHTDYMNNYAKHHDKTSKNVLEYIMYQTGNIIRLLITLKQEE